MTASTRATAAFAVVLVMLTAPPGSARLLEEELPVLLTTHPQIRAQRSSLEAARQTIDQAYSGYLPSIDFTGNVGPTYIETDQRTAAGLGAFSETQQVAGVTVTQNLFDGFETPSQVKIARFNVEVAQQTLEGTTQDVLLQGISAYADVLRQRRLVELALQSEGSIRTQTELEDERVVRGAGIAVDVLQAKARLQIAKERRVGFEGSLQDAISRYIQVFNHAPELDKMEDPSPPSTHLPPDIEKAIDVAGIENPAVRSSLATVEVASERRRLAQSGYYPSIDIVGAAGYEKDFDLQQGVRTDFSVLLQATWNIFNGFATTAGVKQAAYDYSASRENHEFVSRTVIEATRIAWQQLQTAQDRLDLLANAVVIAEEAFVARRRLREAGRETVIDVLLAEDEVTNARIQLTVARYEAIVATYRVLQAIGRLNADTLALGRE